ncbi:MAG TPA: serine/threonine-protein kinase [Marinagarivorans sp.]
MDNNETRLSPSKHPASAATELDDGTVIQPLSQQNTQQPERRAQQSTQVSPVEAPADNDTDLGVIKDRFELVKSIGSGGMGDVFLARDRVRIDMEDSQPYVAIKVLKGNFSTMREAAQALQREAKKAQLLSHPNIVTVYDFDRDKDLVFITMEYLQGESLEDYLSNRGQMPPEQALKTITLAAEGLAYAHKKGYVHADIKPANIFLTREGGVKILDFGIAQAVRSTREEALSAGESWTQYALTPSYASPEMIARQDLHPSDDIYGLGVVFHELLTGKHPFLDADNRPTPADQAAERNAKVMPIKALSRRHHKALVTALSFDGKTRYPNARELIKALQPPSKLKWALYASSAIAAASIVLTIAVQTHQPPPPTLANLPPALDKTRNFISEADELLATGEIGMAHRLYAQGKNALDTTENIPPKDLQAALYLLRERRVNVIEALTQRLQDSTLSRFQLKEIQLALEYLYNDELTDDKDQIAQQIAQLKQRINSEDSQ